MVERYVYASRKGASQVPLVPMLPTSQSERVNTNQPKPSLWDLRADFSVGICPGRTGTLCRQWPLRDTIKVEEVQF